MHQVDLVAATLPRTLAAVTALTAIAVALAVRFFGLTIGGALSLYFVIWWTALFAVLPFGIRSQHEDGPVTPGTDPGAPSLPRLREKAVWTTLLAGAVLVATALMLPLPGL